MKAIKNFNFYMTTSKINQTYLNVLQIRSKAIQSLHLPLNDKNLSKIKRSKNMLRMNNFSITKKKIHQANNYITY